MTSITKGLSVDTLKDIGFVMDDPEKLRVVVPLAAKGQLETTCSSIQTTTVYVIQWGTFWK